jgi:hypothetical protein
METQNISPCKKKKNLTFKKNPHIKETKNPSRYYNSFVTNLKFQHNPKYHLPKNPHIKIDLLLLLPRSQNHLGYYYYTLQ